MELLFVTPELRRLDETQAEVLVAGVFEDERPPRGVAGLVGYRLGGRVDRLCESRFLTGKVGETLWLTGRPRLTIDKVLLFGLGPKAGFDATTFEVVVERVLQTLTGLAARSAVVELPGRHADAMPAEIAADRFVAAASEHGPFDTFTLVEHADAHKRIAQHMIEERRRVRRF